MLLKEKNKEIFTDTIRFKFPWRKYQERFLANFETHKEDRHLHVIAPPGAGKTILGLEMIRRVNRTTLVLSPTLTIKNQWKKRFEDFFDTENSFQGISTDVKDLKTLNFTTYQGVYALYKSMGSVDAFANYFKKNNIEVLVLDEAHHLKTAWWKALIALKNNSNLIIIALTATPPFDSSHSEMKRYFELCGPVDEEITIPELVKEKALCPHQDYVYLSAPEKEGIQYIFEYRQKIATFVQFLTENENFIRFLKAHPYYLLQEKDIEEVCKNPSYLAAILIFLHHCKVPIDTRKLAFFGFEEGEEINFPSLTLDWVETLLQYVLIGDSPSVEESDSLLNIIEKDLRKIGGINGKKIQLLGNESVFKKLTHSISKLRSINAIVLFEQQNLGDKLRLVVLTDYIRKEFLGLHSSYSNRIDKMGLVPIFHYLKNSKVDCSKLALLSGSLVIIHQSCLEALRNEYVLKDSQIKPIDKDTDFVQIIPSSSHQKSLVSVITSLFEKGAITILLGTKSLLGEGWDAPSINALIMASNVGSFVSSNQMRGRAIRAGAKGKTSHVWHLASVDQSVEDGGYDIQQLQRRFTAFVGVDASSLTILSGIERLGLPRPFFPDFDVEDYNATLFEKSINREKLPEQWTKSIVKGTRLNREIKLDFIDEKLHKKQKSIAVTDMVKILSMELGIGLLYFVFEFSVKNALTIIGGGFITVLRLFLIGVFTYLLPKTYTLVKHYILYGNTHKLLEKIAKTVLQTMEELQLLTTSYDVLKFVFKNEGAGQVTCTLIGGTYHENATFVTALEELLSPIDSPKYLIHRHSWMQHKIGVFNVHAVPEVFSKKKNANVFFNHWKKNIGKADLVFAHRLEGRKLIVKSRLLHVKYTSSDLVKDQVVWK
ncbi:MAG: hypothetical protein COB81_05550 [Flavobacteriaceae bacterium]|nr:MAG: hypothetical protein COB81_05550 [Flavobacteriaceae bacterium]